MEERGSFPTKTTAREKKIEEEEEEKTARKGFFLRSLRPQTGGKHFMGPSSLRSLAPFISRLQKRKGRESVHLRKEKENPSSSLTASPRRKNVIGGCWKEARARLISASSSLSLLFLG